jgi:hypothetical protein
MVFTSNLGSWCKSLSSRVLWVKGFEEAGLDVIPVALVVLGTGQFLDFPLFIPGSNLRCIVKRVSWFKSSLLLRIKNKHTYKY